MKKILNYIILFPLLAIFIITAGGLSYTQHHCHKSNSDFILFFDSGTDDCCTDKGCCECESAEESACCITEYHHQKSNLSICNGDEHCCINLPHFIKITSKYLPTPQRLIKKITKPLINFIFTINKITNNQGFSFKKETIYQFPPGTYLNLHIIICNLLL